MFPALRLKTEFGISPEGFISEARQRDRSGGIEVRQRDVCRVFEKLLDLPQDKLRPGGCIMYYVICTIFIIIIYFVLFIMYSVLCIM